MQTPKTLNMHKRTGLTDTFLCKKQILLFILFLTFFQGLSQTRELVFTPHWLPQAQFAGYYVAQDQGFYTDAGIEVKIIHPSASVNAIKFLEREKADIITLFLVTALGAAKDGLDLVNIAQFSQHSAIMFVSMKSSGIETLADFEGRKVGIWRSGFREVPLALLNQQKVSVEWVPILSTVNLFLLGGIDVMTVMWYNEYHQIYLSGVNMDEMNTFFMSDYGFDIPEDGLYVLRSNLDKREEDFSAFVEASLRGWEYAAHNKEYTVDLVVKLMRDQNIPSNHAHQRWMLDKILELKNYEGKNIHATELHENDFEKTRLIIETISGSDFSIDYNDFHRPLLPAISKKRSP
jgi:NitT/TauT family transport system substrate-binding protein